MIENIRNFCIIAHVDHGKSTLADRILELTGAITTREITEQVLDNMDLEKERGITIKSRPVRLKYTLNSQEYILNLIDTPGHVDFNYEVSRSILACEGAILIVDSTDGVAAQTLSNAYLAFENNLEVIPVINKIDLASSEPGRVKNEIENIIGVNAENCPLISAKNGIGIEEVLKSIVEGIPAPNGDRNAPLKALIFDSFYNSFKGVVVYIKIVDGFVKIGDKIRLMSNEKVFEVVELGYMLVKDFLNSETLMAGEVGFLTASIKSVKDVHVGDTITSDIYPAKEAILGYKEAKSVVFCGIYPVDGKKYDLLRDALEKLQLNDASLNFELETSSALGFGFRCGFLGLLHMDIVKERLEREWNLELIITTPSVMYKITTFDGKETELYNPVNMPPINQLKSIKEPMIDAEIITPSEFIGEIIELCESKRGTYKEVIYIEQKRVNVKYELPLAEIVYDFFDILKSKTKGYASFEYEISRYNEADLVKVDILLNGDIVDALSLIVARQNAEIRGRKITEKLKNIIPRHLFEIPIQAAINGKVIARETVKALRKDVTAKCYGGDISRKKKLLEKQKEGKKKMRQVGKIYLPDDAFITILKIDEN